VTSPRSTTLQGWGQEGRDCPAVTPTTSSQAGSSAPLSPPQGWRQFQGGWPPVYQGWPEFSGTHHAGGMGPGPYPQERHWGSYLPQGDSKMVTTISTAPAGQRGGVSALASSSQHPAGGNLTTAPHHSGWNSGGYLGHPSWRGYPPHGQPPYRGFHQGYPEPYPYGYQASGFPIGPGYQRFPGSNYGNSDPKASASAVKPQGSTGHPIPPPNLFGST
jgi:hypothetical protein